MGLSTGTSPLRSFSPTGPLAQSLLIHSSPAGKVGAGWDKHFTSSSVHLGPQQAPGQMKHAQPPPSSCFSSGPLYLAGTLAFGCGGQGVLLRVHSDPSKL